MNEKRYGFKYSNHDLELYIANRKGYAAVKRRKAEILQMEADAIEHEMRELESNLLLVDESDESNGDKSGD